MSRLTKKDKRHKSGYQIPCSYASYYDDVFIKLGKLEDIEDELGCPLEVVFKALKDGIIDENNEYRDVMLVHSKKGYWFREFSEDLPKLWIKDYKKTWWLKEDLRE